MVTSVKNEEKVITSIIGVIDGLVLDNESRVILLVRIHVGAPVVSDLVPEHFADLVFIDDRLALFRSPVAIRFAVLALEPDTAEVLVLFSHKSGVDRAHFVGNEEFALSHVVDGPGAAVLLGHTPGGADAVFAGWHVNIDSLHGEPRSEDTERDHSHNTSDGRVVTTVSFVGETNRLAKPVELLEEFSVCVLGHTIILL